MQDNNQPTSTFIGDWREAADGSLPGGQRRPLYRSPWQVWWKVSEQRLYRCCQECYRSRADERGIVPNNGYEPVDQPYPHADWCPHQEVADVQA